MTLKIEAGKFYRTRDGRKVGPIYEVRGDGVAYWSGSEHDGEICCFSNGKIRLGKVECGGDLIAEWTDAHPEIGTLQELDVKPGDVVIYSGPDAPSGNTQRTISHWSSKDAAWKYVGQPSYGFMSGKGPWRIVSRATPQLDTPPTIPLAPTDPYAELRRVLDAAYEQAANGKGKERHANDKPFTAQPIMEIARMVGPGYQLGQAMKKAQEAGGMIQRGQPDRAKAELLGAINYLAACVLMIEEAEK